MPKFRFQLNLAVLSAAILVAFAFSLALMLPAFAEPSPLPGVIPVIDTVTNALPTEGAIKTAIGMALGFLFEVIVRRWPTKNPQSVWLWARALVGQLARLFSKLDAFMDAVAPQKLKQQ